MTPDRAEPLSLLPEPDHASDFDRFYAGYPKKRERGAALRAFGSVVGVPRGGLIFADALRAHVTEGAPGLIADDVLTTGASMEVLHAEHPETRGAVVFARGLCPEWVTPLFQMDAGALVPAEDDRDHLLFLLREARPYVAAHEPDPQHLTVAIDVARGDRAGAEGVVPADQHAQVCAELERLRRAYRATIPLDQAQMQRVIDAVGGEL